MPITSSLADGTLTIKIEEPAMRGSLQKDFRNCYHGVIDNAKEVVLDFRSVEFTDSSGVGLLFLLYGASKTSPTHPKLSITNASPEIKETLKISGIDRNFQIQ